MHDVNQQGQSPAPSAPGVPPNAQQPQKPPVVPIMFGFFTLMGVGWSANHGWLGIGLGLAVIASAVVAHQRGHRALVAFVWKKPPGVLWTVATGALGALYITLGIGKLGADRKQAAAAEERAQALVMAQKAHSDEQQRLLEQLPQAVSGFREQLTEALRSAESAGASEGLRRVKLVNDAIAALAARLDGPPPPNLRAVEQEAAQQGKALAARVELQQNYESIETQLGFAKEAIGHKNWLAADGDYAGALTSVDSVENARATLAPYIPQAFDAQRKRAEISALRARITVQVAAAKKQQAEEEDKRIRRAAYEAICGPAPGLRRGDEAWVLLKMKLEKVANDPDSIEIVDCTPPVLTEKICWATRCNIRGKNAFGHPVIQQKWFSFSKLSVEEATLPGQ